MPLPPPEIGRNAFDEWCWRRDLKLREVAEILGVSIEAVRLIQLPFSNPKRRVPNTLLAERIYAYTRGEIVPAHFFPPALRGRAEPALETAGARS